MTYTLTCAVCGKQFSSLRPTRQYCSDLCQAVLRKRKKAEYYHQHAAQICRATSRRRQARRRYESTNSLFHVYN